MNTFLPCRHSLSRRHSRESGKRFSTANAGHPLSSFHPSKAKSFRAPAARESLFSCVAKRKVTKREGHPAWRLPPIHGRQVREAGPGFSTAHPCAGEKESASCRFPLRGLSSPPHRRTGAPGRAAGHPGPHSVRNGCAAAKVAELPSSAVPQVPVYLCGSRSARTERWVLSQVHVSFACAFASAFAFASFFASAFDRAFSRVRAGCALLFRGPCATVSWGRQARRGIGRKPIPFRQHTDVLSKSPAPAHGLAGHGCPTSVKRGGLSLWLSFSLATQRESNSPSEGGRKLLALMRQIRARTLQSEAVLKSFAHATARQNDTARCGAFA